jgi:hypothetical protein
MAQNRTINFYGYAYGNTPVSLTANINGVTVFSGPVTTVDEVLPPATANINNAPVLFSVADSALFPTDFGGAYPMSIEVTGGYGIVVQDTYCNYMDQKTILVEATGSTIDGTTLTLGNVIAGNINNVYIANVITGYPGAPVSGPGVNLNTSVTALSTDGTTLQITPSQTVGPVTVTIVSRKTSITPGNAEAFFNCYTGTPSNSEGTPDSRSSVQIDGVDQVPPNPVSLGQWTWIVPTGSTLSCAFNVSYGNAYLY